MLVLSTLHSLLSQIVSPGKLHTAVLLTPAGELVSAASNPQRPKDEVRVIVGLGGEVWRETRDQGIGMVDSELGRILVLPVDDNVDNTGTARVSHRPPLMLLALNASENVDWEELQTKGAALASHLAKPLGQFRDVLAPVTANGFTSSSLTRLA
ncbi:hypothetical protein AGABI1DRAFT_110591 [Agaricus bisporus var. burnettii JB137-S8]|uniref:Roadblock/LAMTOR2 domain-containing protein n=2 Tax=Agaricus bisporus var. burnettii TaxID=192524 RepID=K5XKC9_AGABU|nr:hypothetical protein AGABI2DRAFT_189508 [Agaricus bisporus var. bisporus H97]XP_007325728.1 uncharacterized protein AGABI1DRAFT_110591 [Agaricus bisporus var. burnettii JB137-S8]EKM83988.1 hypothetical protein AGABI1DRAFT_110591 [Agaricus bisporus var. burnettii JB137-S8]EKV51248.1 hypothetical protein AGABI2DRAFT_189508 [Agaricus bisporus var. bisporus H97]KAF7784208.1 hypothetical protein Agabi119p4_373 [Agaricus bisporus var. burnettii]